MVFLERLRAAPARELVVVFTREELRYLREDLALHEGADGAEVAGVFFCVATVALVLVVLYVSRTDVGVVNVLT